MFGSAELVVMAIVIVGLSVGAALIVLWLVRRLISHDRLTPHNEVSGFVYAVIGVIYAVILGFVVVSVWEQFRDAESNARQEADAAKNLYRLAEGLPQPSRQAIQPAVIDYAGAVVDDEWPAMADGTPLSQWELAHLDAL